MNDLGQKKLFDTRRHFLRQSSIGLGAWALSELATRSASAVPVTGQDAENPLAPKRPPLPAKVKRVIYLHMSGAPPQHDLWDNKPELNAHHLEPCPDDLLEILKRERLPFIDLKARRPKMLGTPHKFVKRGASGLEMSELWQHLPEFADDLCLIKSMHTDQFNHAPAELFLYTGSPRNGGAAMGSWITYGLGSENQDLPGFVVLISGGTDPTGGKALWSTGFLPSVYQGVQCRSVGDPILYATNPAGMSRETRRRSLDALQKLNELELAEFGDPETLTRISQYELAYRMQIAVPEVMDISRESKETLAAYGAEPGKASFANNCLLARRLAEQGVRYVQLYDWGWDMHGIGTSTDLVTGLPGKVKETDKPIAALLRDLKQRGLLAETLVIWGGEFGRTALNEERGGSKFLGRDHHPHCFSIWLAGGGVKAGHVHGETDEIGYFVTRDKVGVHDLQATILHLLGLDAKRFSFPYQGLNQRLIGPSDEARLVKEILA
ncbi:MAG: DUF1501 domain-containing protein [Pirellulaceae bacterium]|nr:DUF1501 domain-containing protein [Pirellulaceae bacterium]